MTIHHHAASINDEETAKLVEQQQSLPIDDAKLDVSRKRSLWDNCKVHNNKLGAFGALMLFVILFFVWSSSSSGNQPTNHDIHQSIHHIHSESDGSSSGSEKDKDKNRFATMKVNLTTAKETLYNRLRLDYGPYFEPIFLDDSNKPRKVFVSGDPASTLSYHRLLRKFMLKLLQSQQQQQQDKKVQFIWATGGHSAAAGHGNFFHESYTAVLSTALQPLFASLGLEFVARPYAMGATNGAPEVAFCVREIFGNDIDALVWDFGMMEAGKLWKQRLYHIRAGVVLHKRTTTKTMPIQFAMHAHGQFESDRLQIMNEMEQIGLAAFTSPQSVTQPQVEAIPDSFGKTEAEINALPPLVRNFRCDKQIELGDPYCLEQKYNYTMCKERSGRVSWHPGYKWHALVGNSAALYLIEVLQDALDTLSRYSAEDTEALLKNLTEQQDQDYQQFFAAPVPNTISEHLPKDLGIDPYQFIKGPVFCHTARLPAESRFKGIVTESPQTGSLNYDKGTALKSAMSAPPIEGEGGSMPLVYDETEREDCPVTTYLDFKDFFFVNSQHWGKLVLPNDAEMKEYGTGADLHGVVSFCFRTCAWNRCPDQVLGPNDFGQGFEMMVNGVSVSNLTMFEECHLLRHEEGYKFPVVNGRMEIGARVTEAAKEGSYLQFSAFILW